MPGVQVQFELVERRIGRIARKKSSGSSNMQDGFIGRCFVPVNSVHVSLSPELLNFSSNRETVEAVPASLLERPIRALSGATYR